MGNAVATRLSRLLGVALILLGCSVTDQGATGVSSSASPLPTQAGPIPAGTASPMSAWSTPDEARYVDDLLGKMTLEEKVGQVFLVFFTGPSLSPMLKETIDQYHVGGLLLFNVAGNIESPVQVGRMINEAQREATSSGARIPLFIAVDQEGGPVVRLTEGATVFPSNMAVGASDSLDNARLEAEVVAGELKAVGVNLNLAPVLDVNSNPNNPVIGLRSYGSSPERVAELGSAAIRAYAMNGIIATAKHFPGHGDTSVDSHVGLPVVSHDLAHLQANELLPFRAAIAAGVPAIMTAHVEVPALEPTPGLPATLSSRVLSGLLRQEMGFQGLVITDSMTMGAVVTQYGIQQATVLAFQAGADVLAFGADPGHTPAEQRAAQQGLLNAVRSGTISEQRLDESVRRILLTKARYGVLDWQPANVDAVAELVGTPANQQAARDLAQSSITLVRNEKGLLPLRADQPVLLVWPRAAGELGAALQAYHRNLTVLPISLDPTVDEIQQAAEAAAEAAVTVVATDDVSQHPAQAQLVEALAGRPLIVAAIGVPYDFMAFPTVGCYLVSYGSVPVSLEALARVLAGAAKPQGHLPVELPGLFPLGSGISF